MGTILMRTFALVLVFAFLMAMPVASLQRDRSIRVKFPRGRTSTVISDSVVRGTRDNYILGARSGQKMTVRITSREDNAVFDIYTPGDGETLAQEATDWSGRLPVSGDYTVSVGGTRGNASYKLELMIR